MPKRRERTEGDKDPTGLVSVPWGNPDRGRVSLIRPLRDAVDLVRAGWTVCGRSALWVGLPFFVERGGHLEFA